MDASARVTMKDAAKCDKRREWQNSENQENAERILHFRDPPGSMSVSGPKCINALNVMRFVPAMRSVVVCQCIGCSQSIGALNLVFQ